MGDLLTIARKACEVAAKAGAEFVDVAAHRGKKIGVEIEKNTIKSADARWTSGLSVRAYIKGGMGYASVAGLDEKDILHAARQAAELAKVAQPDPDFVSLPSPALYPKVEGTYDPPLAEVTVSQAVRWAVENVDAAQEVAPGGFVNGGVEVGCGESALANSLGVAVENRGSSIGAEFFVIVKRGGDVGSFFDFDSARVLADFAPVGLGAKAAGVAKSFLGSRKIATTTMPVILGPIATWMLFSSLAQSCNAEDVQRRRSFMMGRRGEKIASELLTIVDDPLVPRGLATSAYDGEGFPRKTLTLIEEGVLTTYLHNSYTANKAKEPNTGHSTRGGIAPTNIRPQPGRVTAAEVIGDTKEGLYVNMGSLRPNRVTGDISASVDFGFKIENGELAYPVMNTMVGVNIFDLLQNIDAISSDYREEPGFILPTVRVQGVRVAGGK